ncbi:lysosomal alpha-glucosidase-like [Ornithodoros turicata]|uniref:lysosomal alpha-glucosidase-like n=1 Tax=Ornithodoros turicata TaxID=34597 RepID=UPI0031397475
MRPTTIHLRRPEAIWERILRKHCSIKLLACLLCVLLLILDVLVHVILFNTLQSTPRKVLKLPKTPEVGMRDPFGMAVMELKRCSAVAENHRQECHPDPGVTNDSCIMRGCCYVDHNSTSGGPSCYYPLIYDGYRVDNIAYGTEKSAVRVVLRRTRSSGFSGDAPQVIVDVNFHSSATARISIGDVDKRTFESNVPEVHFAKVSGSDIFDVHVTDIGDLVVYRKSNKVVIFETDLSTLVYTSTFLQLPARVPTSHFYGLGDMRARLARSGFKQYSLINMHPRDAEAEHVQENNSKAVYGSHPFYMGIEPEGLAYGIFFRTRSVLQVQSTRAPGVTVRTIGGPLDLFVFLGPSPSHVVSQYQDIVGRPAMPPFWALGFQQTVSDILVAELLNEQMWANMNIDGVWSDKHALEKGCDFVFLKAVEERLRDVPSRHYVVRMGPTVHTNSSCKTGGVFIQHARFYNAIMLNHSGTPVEILMPDNTTRFLLDYRSRGIRSFLGRVFEHRASATSSISGVWLDDNEVVMPTIEHPSCKASAVDTVNFLLWNEKYLNEGPRACEPPMHVLGPQYRPHNAFAYHQAATLHEFLAASQRRRPLVVSKSTYSGIGKFAGHNFADLEPTWKNLRLTIPMMLTMSLLGVPLSGADACGRFQENVPLDELCSRWYSLAAFYPLFHARSVSGLKHDHSVFSVDVAKDASASARIRRTLLPYLYYLFYKSHVAGETVARPMFLEFPLLNEVRENDQQFMWGSAVMILPVLYSRAIQYQAFVPSGLWYDYYTHKVINGSDGYRVFSALSHPINVLLRGGHVIPITPHPNIRLSNGMKYLGVFVLLDGKMKARGEIFCDGLTTVDSVQSGRYSLIQILFIQESIVINPVFWGYDCSALDEIIILGLPEPPSRIVIAKRQMNFRVQNTTVEVPGLNLHLNTTTVISLHWYSMEDVHGVQQQSHEKATHRQSDVSKNTDALNKLK